MLGARPQPGPPQATTVNGDPHMLAYITPDEAYILRNRGGGLGAGGSQMMAQGVPAFDDDNGGDRADRAGNTNDSVGDGGGANYGGGNGGYGFDTRGSDVADRAGGAAATGMGSDDGGTDGSYGSMYDARASDVQSRAGSPSTGNEAGFFGGEANYGGGPGNTSGNISGGGGGSEGNQPYYAPPATPQAPLPPPGPTPEELAAQEAARHKKLQDDSEARVRAKYDASLGAVWRKGVADQFDADARGILDTAYGTTREGLLQALRDSGYIATPLATARLTGLDTQKAGEAQKIPTTRDTRLTDYDTRRNASLVDAITRARALEDPDKAEALAIESINAYNTDLQKNPGATFTPGFTPDNSLIEPGSTPVERSASDAFKNALLTVSSPNAAARVG
jgi:hypothetical protein